MIHETKMVITELVKDEGYSYNIMPDSYFQGMTNIVCKITGKILTTAVLM